MLSILSTVTLVLAMTVSVSTSKGLMLAVKLLERNNINALVHLAKTTSATPTGLIFDSERSYL